MQPPRVEATAVTPAEAYQHDLLIRLIACASRDERLELIPILSPAQVECLSQLRSATWDGNLISKDIRTELVQIGMAERWNGWTFITKLGIIVLHTLGMLKP